MSKALIIIRDSSSNTSTTVETRIHRMYILPVMQVHGRTLGLESFIKSIRDQALATSSNTILYINLI